MRNNGTYNQIYVRNQNISRIDNFYVVAKSKSYLTAEFSFLTPDWQGVTKTAIFHDKDTSYTQILTDDKCEVPWEWLANAGTKQVSVFGGELITVNMADVTIYESGYKEGKTPEPPTPTVYEQIIAMLNEIETGGIPDDKISAAVQAYLEAHPVEILTEEDVQRIVAEYVAAHKDELKGDKGDKGDTGAPGADGNDGAAGADGYTPVRGTDYWTADDIAEIQTYIDSQIGGALNGSY